MYIHVDGSVNLHYTCPCQHTVKIMCDGAGGDNLRENPEPLISFYPFVSMSTQCVTQANTPRRSFAMMSCCERCLVIGVFPSFSPCQPSVPHCTLLECFKTLGSALQLVMSRAIQGVAPISTIQRL